MKFTYKPAQKPFLHPYQAAEVFCDGQKIGYLGQVRYEICDELDMRVPAYVMELDLEFFHSGMERTEYLLQSQNLMMRREILLCCGQGYHM